MELPGADTVLIRHGEIFTKSKSVQQRMEDRLEGNLRAILHDRGLDATVAHHRMRPRIETNPEIATDVAAAASDVFGVYSVSPAREITPEKDTIIEALVTAATANDFDSFAVDPHRSDKSLPFDSRDIAIEAGAAIQDATGTDVDLDDPDITFSVEMRSDEAHVYVETIPGPRGLPLGTQAPVVALISGGIDSPVAAYEMMRRGAPVIPVYVSLGAYGGPDHEARALSTIKTLQRYAPNFDLAPYVVDGGAAAEALKARMGKGRMVAWRRVLYRAAEIIADRENAVGIVTGEAMGQKSSQTMTNFAVTAKATDLPIHRPLLSWDKADIVEHAKDIGTYDDSTIPAGCNQLAPNTPATATSLELQHKREPDSLFDMAEKAGTDAHRIEF